MDKIRKCNDIICICVCAANWCLEVERLITGMGVGQMRPRKHVSPGVGRDRCGAVGVGGGGGIGGGGGLRLLPRPRSVPHHESATLTDRKVSYIGCLSFLAATLPLFLLTPLTLSLPSLNLVFFSVTDCLFHLVLVKICLFSLSFKTSHIYYHDLCCLSSLSLFPQFPSSPFTVLLETYYYS